ncbi:hypothetical protein VTO42DRAFT_1961 [Malbranchea cinnamomea]
MKIGLGAGLAVKIPNTPFTQHSWNVGKNYEVFDAELSALDKAFQYAVNACASLSQVQEVWAIQRLPSNYIGAGQGNEIADKQQKVVL